jgi:hypothetical protein
VAQSQTWVGGCRSRIGSRPTSVHHSGPAEWSTRNARCLDCSLHSLEIIAPEAKYILTWVEHGASDTNCGNISLGTFFD